MYKIINRKGSIQDSANLIGLNWIFMTINIIEYSILVTCSWKNRFIICH